MKIKFLGREYELERLPGTTCEVYQVIAIDVPTCMTLSIRMDHTNKSWIAMLRWGFYGWGGRLSLTLQRNEDTVEQALQNLETGIKVLQEALKNRD